MAKKISPQSDEEVMRGLVGNAVNDHNNRVKQAAEAAAPAQERGDAPIAPDADELANSLKTPEPGSKTINVKVSKQAHAAFKAASAIEGLQYCELLEKLLRDAYPYLFTR